MFSNKDIVAVRVNNVNRTGKRIILVSAYMANEEPVPPDLLQELTVFAENEGVPTIIGTDANAHHTLWGSTNVNTRGENLLNVLCKN